MDQRKDDSTLHHLIKRARIETDSYNLADAPSLQVLNIEQCILTILGHLDMQYQVVLSMQ